MEKAVVNLSKASPVLVQKTLVFWKQYAMIVDSKKITLASQVQERKKNNEKRQVHHHGND